MAKKRIIYEQPKRKKAHPISFLLVCAIVFVGAIYVIKNPSLLNMLKPKSASGSNPQNNVAVNISNDSSQKSQEYAIPDQPSESDEIDYNDPDYLRTKSSTKYTEAPIENESSSVTGSSKKTQSDSPAGPTDSAHTGAAIQEPLNTKDYFYRVWSNTASDQSYRMQIDVDLSAKLLFSSKNIQIKGYVDNNGGKYTGDVYIKMPNYDYDYSYSAPCKKIYFENETQLYSPELGAIVSIPMNFASYETGFVRLPPESALGKATYYNNVFAIDLNAKEIQSTFGNLIDYLLDYFEIKNTGDYSGISAKIIAKVSNDKITEYVVTASGKISGTKCTASINIKII